jgi:hypothetical protein
VALSPLALAACDIDPPRPADPGPDAGAGATPTEDSVLVADLVAAVAEAEGVVAAARATHAGLAPVLDPLLAAHTAHRELLADAAPDADAEPSAGGVPAGRGAAMAAVRRVERRLQRRVERACVAARSGDLARVLASIAGSLAQHAVALEAPVPAEVAP